ncbi:MAG TPA: TetR/AcrR family transcriptional regulator [Actinomycetes bacterium]
MHTGYSGLAERLGIRAPSLYKHLPDKAALETAIIATGFEDTAAVLEEALASAERSGDDPLERWATSTGHGRCGRSPTG